MTRKQALDAFVEMYGGREAFRKAKKDDYPSVQFDWQTYKDGLCKGGEITQRQYDRWDNP